MVKSSFEEEQVKKIARRDIEKLLTELLDKDTATLAIKAYHQYLAKGKKGLEEFVDNLVKEAISDEDKEN